MEDRTNGAVHMYLHGAKLLMTINLSPYNAGTDQYRIELFDSEIKEYAYSGNLQETIELILLGKSYKAQLQAEGKKEPIGSINVSGLINGLPVFRKAEVIQAKKSIEARELLDNG